MISAVSNSTPVAQVAPVQEIFSSFQGEGIFVGKRQIFVRFAHCHLKCAYCDTPMTTPTGQCHLESPPGSGEIQYLENPMTVPRIQAVLAQLLPLAKHHSISFTGGEPLLYHRFLKELFPWVQQHCPTYLETSGTQPEFLEAVLPWVSTVAMDIKLPSTTHEPPQFEQHAQFYTLAQSHAPSCQVFIKLIINNDTSEEELQAVRDIVSDTSTPIILQPETSLSDKTVSIRAKALFWAESFLSTHFQDVRVIPQTHKMLNVL
jgi:organic radical activating enzyme